MQIQHANYDDQTPSARTSNQRPRILGPREIDPELRRQMVAEAAYYTAIQRGFSSGHELEDWLVAEQQVGELLHGGARL